MTVVQHVGGTGAGGGIGIDATLVQDTIVQKLSKNVGLAGLIRNVPWNANGMGTDTIRVPLFAHGVMAAAPSGGSAPSVSNVGTTSVDISVARKALAHQIAGQYLEQSPEALNMELANGFFASFVGALEADIVALFADGSLAVAGVAGGGAGDEFDMDVYDEAAAILRAKGSQGGWVLVLSPAQYQYLLADVRADVGTSLVLLREENGRKMLWDGTEVIVSATIASTGRGCLFERDAFAFTVSRPVSVATDIEVLSDTHTVVGSATYGVAILDADRAVAIRSQATS